MTLDPFMRGKGNRPFLPLPALALLHTMQCWRRLRGLKV